jgi:hypothetical protein
MTCEAHAHEIIRHARMYAIKFIYAWIKWRCIHARTTLLSMCVCIDHTYVRIQVTVLFNQQERLALQRIVGTSRAERLLTSDKSTHMFS